MVFRGSLTTFSPNFVNSVGKFFLRDPGNKQTDRQGADITSSAGVIKLTTHNVRKSSSSRSAVSASCDGNETWWVEDLLLLHVEVVDDDADEQVEREERAEHDEEDEVEIHEHATFGHRL